MYFVFDGLRDRHKIKMSPFNNIRDMTGEQTLLQVHPVQRCELSCHLLTCHIVQKGYVKVGRLYRWKTGEVLSRSLGNSKQNCLKTWLLLF